MCLFIGAFALVLGIIFDNIKLKVKLLQKKYKHLEIRAKNNYFLKV